MFTLLRRQIATWRQRQGADKVGASKYADLPTPARLFLAAVFVLSIAVLLADGPREMPHLTTFGVLLVASSLASALKLRLPLGSSASNLSISYTFDFAALILVGT